jgi:hypothetical protein
MLDSHLKINSFLAQKYENTKDLLSLKAYFRYFNLVHIYRLVMAKIIVYMATAFLLLVRINYPMI